MGHARRPTSFIRTTGPLVIKPTTPVSQPISRFLPALFFALAAFRYRNYCVCATEELRAQRRSCPNERGCRVYSNGVQRPAQLVSWSKNVDSSNALHSEAAFGPTSTTQLSMLFR